MVMRGRNRGHDVIGAFGAQAGDAHRLQHGLGRLAHWVLPRVSLAEIAAHADEGQERKSAAAGEREHVDAVADTAALHQEDAARAAEIGAGQQRHALLLCGQGDGVDAGVGQRPVDQDPVPGIGDVGELRDVVAAQQVVDLVLPNHLDFS